MVGFALGDWVHVSRVVSGAGHELVTIFFAVEFVTLIRIGIGLLPVIVVVVDVGGGADVAPSVELVPLFVYSNADQTAVFGELWPGAVADPPCMVEE